MLRLRHHAQRFPIYDRPPTIIMRLCRQFLLFFRDMRPAKHAQPRSLIQIRRLIQYHYVHEHIYIVGLCRMHRTQMHIDKPRTVLQNRSVLISIF